MRVSLRLLGKSTSILLRDSVCVAHYLITGGEGDVLDHIRDFCVKEVLPQCDSSDGRGLSGKVTDMLIEDMIDPEDREDFLDLLESVEE
jgi:hypothetical protein